MKKSITIGLATVLAIGSFSPAVLAADKNKNDKDKEDERIVERVTVDTLTLEDAIRYGLNSDYSLMELEYSLEKLKISEDAADENFDDVEDNLDAMQDQYKDLQKQLEEEKAASGDSATIDTSEKINSLVEIIKSINDPAIIELVNETEGGGDPAQVLENLLENIETFLGEYKVLEQSTEEKLRSLSDQIYSLTQQYEALDAQLDQLDLNITTTFNSRIQMREGIKLSIASKFIGLLLSQEQINLMKSTLTTQQTEANSAKVRYELGLISEKEYVNATRDLTKLEADISLAEKTLENDKATFALSIGIAYNDNYEVVNPEFNELTLLKQETSTEELIKNSYNMVNARTQLRIAQDNFDYVEDKDDATDEQEDQAEIDIEVAKLNIESLEVELENAITNLYAQLDTQYQALKDAEDELNYAKEDVGDLQLYFDLGLISKQQYESSNTSVEQAQLNYDNAKYQYYLLTQKVKALDEGVIITN